MGQWTALAGQLADDIREPGFGAAAANAAACRARVDPAALRGLVAAALALTDWDALSALWAPADPCPAAAVLVQWTEEIEAHLAALLKRCEDTGGAAQAERDAALKAVVSAEKEAAAAVAAGGDPSPAREHAAEARRAVADCEAALELLSEVDCRLRYALDHVRGVPADLGEVYEAPARLVTSGGTMPHDGDFIAPDLPSRAADAA